MKTILTENELYYVVTESVKQIIQHKYNNILFENREGRNMKKARAYLEQHGYNNPQDRQNILIQIRETIPNSRLMDSYYLLGVTRLFVERQLDNQNAIANLNKDLKYIASDAHSAEYDNNLNGLSADEIHDRFKENENDDFFANKERSDSRTLQANADYDIVRIPDFETASQYGDYTEWCVTHYKRKYDNYTNDGSGLFYFCLRKDYKQVKPIVGENAPLDNYGLSMIAVSVDMQGEMNTITCRWNHSNGGSDTVMSVDELEDLLGVNFYKTFLPYSKEELKAKGKWISEKIGELYDNSVIKGIIASVDANDNPRLIMSMEETEPMTWDDAMEYNKTLRDGWHVPTKEELEEVWHNNNNVTKILNRGLKKYGGKPLEDWHWSSTEYGASYAYHVIVNTGLVYLYTKYNTNYVRPFVNLWYCRNKK